MNKMTEEVKETLRSRGRSDLIETFETIRSGYAGTLPNGNIVDRRSHPEAVPVKENQLLNAPKPQEVEK